MKRSNLIIIVRVRSP